MADDGRRLGLEEADEGDALTHGGHHLVGGTLAGTEQEPEGDVVPVITSAALSTGTVEQSTALDDGAV